MAYIKCDGDLTVTGGSASCSTDWINSQPDYDVLLTQLTALNEFDPLKISLIVISCMVLFIVGFGAGMVVKYLRRL